MKASLPLCAIVTALGLFSVSPAKAAVWDHEYLGKDMMLPPWGGVNWPGLQTSPPETWLRIDGTGGDTLVSLIGGDWQPGSSFTLEFSLALEAPSTGGKWSQGFIIAAGENLGWELLFDVNRISIIAGTNGEYATNLSLGVANTFRFIVNNGLGSLYIDNNPTPVLSGFAGSEVWASYTLLYAGDYGGSMNGIGRWEYLQWNNTQAIDVIPEPAHLALVALGGLALAGWSRRFRGNRSRS